MTFVKTSYKNYLVSLVSFWICLMPGALISGPLIPEIIIFVTSIIFLYLVAVEKNFLYISNRFNKFFYFFLLVLLVSALVNFNSVSIKHSFFYIRFWLFSLTIWYLLNHCKNFLKYFFLSITLTLFCLCVDAIWQKIFSINLFGYPLHGSGRVSSFFGDELVMGSFLAHLFPLYLYLISKTQTSYITTKYIASSLLFFICIFLASSRTSMAIFLISLFFITLFVESLRKKIIYIFLFILVIFFIGYKNKNVNFDRLVNHTIRQISSESNTSTVFSFRHQLHFLTALNIFKENYIFGVGPNYFRYVCDDKKYIPQNYIDNISKIVAKKDGEIKFEGTGRIYKLDRSFVSTLIKDSEIKNVITKNLQLAKSTTVNVISLANNLGLAEVKDFRIFFDYKDKGIENSQNISVNHKGFVFKNSSFIFKKGDTIMTTIPEHKNGCNTHPHNIYIQLLAETGIFGFLFIFSLFFYGLYFLLKSFFYKRKLEKILSTNQALLLISLLSSFFPLLPSGNFFNNWYAILIYFPVGFFIYEFSKKSSA